MRVSGLPAALRRASSDEYTHVVYRRLTAIWRLAARSYVYEALRHVQRDTGMSAASYIPLARALQMVSKIDIYGSRTRVPSYYMSGRPNYSVDKSIASGTAAGENAYVISYGDKNRPLMIFRFTIKVYQYLLQEFGLGNNNRSSAWHSLEAGERAFQQTYDALIQDAIPNIGEYVYRGRLTGDVPEL